MNRFWAFALLCSCASPEPQTPVLERTRFPSSDPAILERGVVASPEPHASEVGAEILRKGGNAVDAAIAVQFALAVTFPNAGNLGGGGFMMVHMAGGERAIDYRETAPAAATRDMFLDEKGDFVPALALTSHKASGVPGTVAGVWLAHQKFGTLPWKALLEPAIRLAEDGWDLDGWTARSFGSLKKNNAPEYFHGQKGERFIQKELAATLRRIAEGGRDGFYKGETARLVVEEMKKGDGLITAEDLAGYEAKVRTPVEGTYRGLRIVSMPPPSSGGIAILQLLGMLEKFDVKAWRFHADRHVHVVCELEKRVFADRSEYLGDPGYWHVPASALLSGEYLHERVKDLNPYSRSDPSAVTHGTVREHEETTHFSIVDKWGNAVSNTTTLNDSYGSGVVVRGAGFLLNNEMDDFSAKPGVPNLFGVIGRAANAIAPGKRMLSSMSPTFVFKNGKLWLVLGTPGGPTIFTTVFQVVVNRVEFGMTLADAVASPRFHHQWPPVKKETDPIFVEKPFDAPVTEALRGMGYAIVPRGRIGDVQAIEIDGGRAAAVCDPRGIGKPATE